MTTALSRRRYRLGLRLFTGAIAWTRYWILIGTVLSIAATAVVAAVRPDFEFSTWRFMVSVLQWFPAVTAGIWLYALLPVYISRGLTRREITVAFIVFGVLASAAAGLFAVLGFLAEHAVLDLVAEPLDTWGGALASGARYLLVAPVYVFGATAVSSLAIRIGDGSALIAVPIALAALVYAGTLVIEFFELTVNSGEWTLLSWIIGGLALSAALVATSSLALRAAPIRAKKA